MMTFGLNFDNSKMISTFYSRYFQIFQQYIIHKLSENIVIHIEEGIKRISISTDKSGRRQRLYLLDQVTWTSPQSP